MQKSDTALMERWIAARDPEAFAQLVDRHAGMVLAACRRVLGNLADAEETAQECFLQVSQAQRAVAPSLGGWLHRLATNRALDRLRSDKARAARERNYAVQQPGAAEPSWNDIQPHVDAIIVQLPDELQTPLVLHFFEGQTHREVARALGIGRSTVTERIQRAIGEIREQLAAKNITLGLAALSGLFGALEVSAAPPALVASFKKIGIATGRSAPPARFPMKWRAAAVAGAIVVLVATLWVSNRRADARDGRDASKLIATNAEAGGEGPNDVPDKVTQVITPVARAAAMTLARAESLEAPLPEAEEQEMIRLRCVDEQGKPVAGAEVYYMWTEFGMAEMLQVDRPENVTRQPFGPVRSDGKGYVEVPATRTPTQTSYGYASAYARIPGRLVGLWHHSPRSLGITGWDSIIMVPSTGIQGVVTVPAGFDVTKVTVKVLTIRLSLGDYPFDTTMPVSSKYQPPLWPRLFQTIPSRDGAYRLVDLPKGHTCYLEFTTPGLGEAQRFNFTIDGNESVDAELFPEGSISGLVRHATGEPATDTPVFACPSIAAESPIGICTAFQAHTDARGRYTIKGLPEATYSVLVQHYGDPPAEITRVLPTVKVIRGEKREGIDFQMEQGALQSGNLIDQESGAPIEGARIVAMNSGAYELTSLEQAIGSVRTDRNGRFTFRLPTGNSFVYFFETPEGYAQPEGQGRTPIQVMPGQTELTPRTFFLTRKSAEEKAPIDRATIEGRVVDEEGRPVAGVPVRVNQMTRPGVQLPFESEARPTNENGRFSVSVLSVGEQQIIVGGGGISSRVESEWFKVQAYERKSIGDLQVAPYDQEVIVILSRFNVDTAVKPPYVSAKNRETLEDLTSGFVDETGRIELHAPDFPLLLTISQEGYKVLQLDVEPGTEMEIALEPEETETEE